MSLWFVLRIGNTVIGDMEIRRQEELDISDPAAVADEVCTYKVEVDGAEIGEVHHRYGDGAWALAGRAIALYESDEPLTLLPGRGRAVVGDFRLPGHSETMAGQGDMRKLGDNE